MIRSSLPRIALAWSAALLAACSGGPDPEPLPVEGPQDSSLTELEAESCVPVVASHDIAIWQHVARDAPVQYLTNPPSSGAHYATWARYGSHREAVDRREYVHNLEHGAVALLYRCPSADGCPALAQAMTELAGAIDEDPECVGLRAGVRARIVVTADPLLDSPIAASAWGATYTSQCLDRASLLAFVRDRYGKGRETTCVDGAGGELLHEARVTTGAPPPAR